MLYWVGYHSWLGYVKPAPNVPAAADNILLTVTNQVLCNVSMLCNVVLNDDGDDMDNDSPVCQRGHLSSCRVIVAFSALLHTNRRPTRGKK